MANALFLIKTSCETSPRALTVVRRNFIIPVSISGDPTEDMLQVDMAMGVAVKNAVGDMAKGFNVPFNSVELEVMSSQILP